MFASLLTTDPGALPWALSVRGRSTEALALARAELDRARKGDDPAALTTALLQIGWCCIQLGQPGEGIAGTGEARTLLALSGDAAGEALASAIYAWLLLETGLPDEGLAFADAAVALSVIGADNDLRAFALIARAVALLYCRENAIGLALQTDALALVDEHTDPSLAALCCINIAYGLASQAEDAAASGDDATFTALMGESVTVNDRAIALAEGCGDGWMQRLALCNGAETYAMLGDTARAFAYVKRCEAVPGAMGLRERIHYLYVRGDLIRAAGDLDAAHELFSTAAALATEAGHVEHMVNTRLRLTAIEEEMGDHAAALAHHKAFHEAYVQQMSEKARRRAQVIEAQLENQRLRHRADRLEAEAGLDALTAIPNRRSFDAAMAQRQGGPLALGLLDIDHFKSVNDRHSHIAGDAVLRRVADILDHCDGVTPYRIGGEEFALIFGAADIGEVHDTADHIRRAIAEACWTDIAPSLAVTASIGIAMATALDPTATLAAADHHLYRAKAMGRNRVTGEDAWAAAQQSHGEERRSRRSGN